MKREFIPGVVDAKTLRDLLDYEPNTGLFKWRADRSNVKAGTVAGCIDVNGYWQITVMNRSRKAHHIAFLYMTGEWPDRHIDHVNQVKHDNRWANLRLANDAQNNANRPVRRDSRSGLKGVGWIAKKRKWRAQIKHAGRSRHLGYFETAQLAHEFWCLASDLLHGEFSHHGYQS